MTVPMLYMISVDQSSSLVAPARVLWGEGVGVFVSLGKLTLVLASRKQPRDGSILDGGSTHSSRGETCSSSAPSIKEWSLWFAKVEARAAIMIQFDRQLQNTYCPPQTVLIMSGVQPLSLRTLHITVSSVGRSVTKPSIRCQAAMEMPGISRR